MLTKSCWYHLALSSLLLVAGCQARVENEVPEPADAPSVQDTGSGTSGKRDGASTGAQSGGTTGASSGTHPGGTTGGSGHLSGKPSGCACDIGVPQTPDVQVQPPTDGGMYPRDDGGSEFAEEGGEPLRYDAVADVFEVLDVVDVKVVEPEVGLDGATTIADAADTHEPSVEADTLVAETSTRRLYGPYFVADHGIVRVDLSTIDICDSCTLTAVYYRGDGGSTVISGSFSVQSLSIPGYEYILATGPQSGRTLSIMARDRDIAVTLYVDQAVDSGVIPVGDAAVDTDTTVDSPQTTERTLATFFVGTDTVDLSTLDICPTCQLYATVGYCVRANNRLVGFGGAVSIAFRRSYYDHSLDTHPTDNVLLGDAVGPRTGSLTIYNGTEYWPAGLYTPKDCALAVSLWSKPVGS